MDPVAVTLINVKRRKSIFKTFLNTHEKKVDLQNITVKKNENQNIRKLGYCLMQDWKSSSMEENEQNIILPFH